MIHQTRASTYVEGQMTPTSFPRTFVDSFSGEPTGIPYGPGLMANDLFFGED